MNKSDIKISIIVASYNYAQYLRENLESIHNQTYKNFEVIVFDDGSSDNSIEIINEYSAKDERFKLITHENNANYGLTVTIQKALEYCTGDYVAFLESDDYWDINYLQEKIDYLTKNPSATVIVNDFKVFGDNKESVEMYEKAKGLKDLYGILRKINKPKPIFFDVENKFGCWVFPTFSIVMVKTDLIKSCNLDAPTRNGLDIWLFKQLMLKGNVGYVDKVLSYFRRTLDSYVPGTANNCPIDEYLKKLYQLMKRDIFYSKFSIAKIIYFYKHFRRIAVKRFGLEICPMDIAFATDENYVMPMTTAIASILKNAGKFDRFNFYILCNSVSGETKSKILELKKIRDCNITFLDISPEQFLNYKIVAHLSLTAYYRIKLPELFPKLKKILYLDCDIIVKASLRELYNIDLKNSLNAGVEDIGCTYWYRFLDDCPFDFMNVINSGVLLMNLDIWRKEKIADKIFDFAQKGVNKHQHDQELINLVCCGKNLMLDYRWNSQDSFFRNDDILLTHPFKKYIKKCAKKPNIIHYTTGKKPWKEDVPLKSADWWYYNRFTPYKIKISNEQKYNLIKMNLRPYRNAVLYIVKRILEYVKQN